ncbi:MAG: hypothetical protein ACKESB_01935 [Candidatus Hodgkinia cicadicola]
MHFGCYLWNLVVEGYELETVDNVRLNAVCVAILISIFKLSDMIGYYGLFKIRNYLSLSYLEFNLKLNSSVLYHLFSHRHSCGGVDCCGMVCTPYDVRASACYFRPLVLRHNICVPTCFSQSELKAVETSGESWNNLPKALNLLQSCSFFSKLRTVNPPHSATRLTSSLCRGNYNIWYARYKRSIYRDDCFKLPPENLLIYLADKHNICVHVHNCPSDARSVVLNERYKTSSGYIKLAADGLIVSDESRVSVVGLIHEVWAKSSSSDVSFYVSSDRELTDGEVSWAISLFLTDGDIDGFVRLDGFEYSMRYFFLNENTWGNALSFRRLGLSKVKLGRLTFAFLPYWRHSFSWFCSISENLTASSEHQFDCRNRIAITTCRPPLLSRICAVSCFTSLGYSECKTSQFLSYRQIVRFKLCNSTELFEESGGRISRFVRSAIYPNLLAHMEGNRFLELVCEQGSIQINNLITRHAVCLIGTLNPLSNLILYLRDQASWPIVFEHIGLSWQAFNADGAAVGTTGVSSSICYAELVLIHGIKQAFELSTDFVLKLNTSTSFSCILHRLRPLLCSVCSVYVRRSFGLAAFSLLVVRFRFNATDAWILEAVNLAVKNIVGVCDCELVWIC